MISSRRSWLRRWKQTPFLSKAVNIVTRSSKGHEGHYQRTSSRYGRRSHSFLEAGPAGTGLRPADHTTRTILTTVSRTQEEGDRPQVAPIPRKEEFSTVWDHKTWTEATEGPTRTTTTTQQLPTCGPHPTLSMPVEEHHSRSTHSRNSTGIQTSLQRGTSGYRYPTNEVLTARENSDNRGGMLTLGQEGDPPCRISGRLCEQHIHGTKKLWNSRADKIG